MSALWLRQHCGARVRGTRASARVLAQTLMALAAADAREEAEPPWVPWVAMLATMLELAEAQPDARACTCEQQDGRDGCVGQENP
jgi:hypothetical protein